MGEGSSSVAISLKPPLQREARFLVCRARMSAPATSTLALLVGFVAGLSSIDLRLLLPGTQPSAPRPSRAPSRAPPAPAAAPPKALVLPQQGPVAPSLPQVVIAPVALGPAPVPVPCSEADCPGCPDQDDAALCPPDGYSRGSPRSLRLRTVMPLLGLRSPQAVISGRAPTRLICALPPEVGARACVACWIVAFRPRGAALALPCDSLSAEIAEAAQVDNRPARFDPSKQEELPFGFAWRECRVPPDHVGAVDCPQPGPRGLHRRHGWGNRGRGRDRARPRSRPGRVPGVGLPNSPPPRRRCRLPSGGWSDLRLPRCCRS